MFAAVVACVFSSAGAWAAPQGQVPPAPQEEEDDDVGIQSIAQTIDTALKLLRGRGLVVSGDPIVILSDVLHDDLVVDSILLREA